MSPQRIPSLIARPLLALGAAALLSGCGGYRTVRILPAALPWTTAAAARDPSATLLVPDPEERTISTNAGFHGVEVLVKDGSPQTFPMPARASLDAKELYVESAGGRRGFLLEQVTAVSLRYDKSPVAEGAALLLLIATGVLFGTAPLVILGPSGDYNVLGGLAMFGTGSLTLGGGALLFLVAPDKPPPGRPRAPARVQTPNLGHVTADAAELTP